MTCSAQIELRDLKIPTKIGTYGQNDIVPDLHLLDLTITINTNLVLINDDSMEKVFDYDPLIAEINRLTINTHYETQEKLISLIVVACAAYIQIELVDIQLRKGPVLNKTGTLGVRLLVDQTTLENMRQQHNNSPIKKLG